MILVEDLHRVFDLWIDKTSSPYFTSNEKDLFINNAVREWLNKYFNPNTSSHQLEKFQYDLSDVEELVPMPITLDSTSNGLVTRKSIEANLNEGRSYSYILRVGRAKSKECGGQFKKVRWVSHNDYLAQQDNSFKKATEDYPIYTIYKDGLVVEPKAEVKVEITVLLQPLKVSLDDSDNTFERGSNAVDLDVSEKCFNEIVYLALKQAGISIRETEFYQITGNESISNE